MGESGKTMYDKVADDYDEEEQDEYDCLLLSRLLVVFMYQKQPVLPTCSRIGFGGNPEEPLFFEGRNHGFLYICI